MPRSKGIATQLDGLGLIVLEGPVNRMPRSKGIATGGDETLLQQLLQNREPDAPLEGDCDSVKLTVVPVADGWEP